MVGDIPELLDGHMQVTGPQMSPTPLLRLAADARCATQVLTHS